ncbi:hypothetical protein F8388_003351 [Cannabis sativa]|uniref:DUF4283 domain-containing protein n=1 Tax=Cannabis sativa TaxID=3483 RepID=A0A7J6FFW4_CANSA|nr:hypothetical protein F8388_003351 [Cannabis sativa]
MADLWKPGKGITIKILDQNRFLFQFYHEIDIQRVIEGSPWTYDRKQMSIQRLKPGENPRMVVLNSLDMWVQIRGLKTGFKTDWARREAAKYIGILVTSDPNNFSLDMKAPTRRHNFLTASPWLRSGKEDHREEHQGFTSTAANSSPEVNARPNNQAKSNASFDSMIAQSHNSGKQYSSHNDHVILGLEST